ncbi:MAG: pyridoxal-phosphate dependent enzyme [Hyphomonadaceae bacterium]
MAWAAGERLKDVDVARTLIASLDYEQRRRLDADAPARFEAPTGSSLLIDYTRRRRGWRSMSVCRKCSAKTGIQASPMAAVAPMLALSPFRAAAQGDHEGLAGLLARLVCSGADRNARALSEASVARRSAQRPADTAGQTKRLLMLPTIEDVKTAAKRIEGITVRTPLLRADALDEATGAKAWVKAECLQRGGAFKMRGATNAIAALAPEVRARGVLAFSSGNHAIAVSTAAKIFGVPATIVMPADAPRIKLETTRANGAEVVTYDRVNESREEIGAKISNERGYALIKPFDDPYVIAGQGTCGLEVGEEIEPDIVFVPASGGGLSAGVSLALPHARIIAVEPEGHNDIERTFAAGSIQRNAPGIRSICDGLLTEQMGELTYAIARDRFERVVTVSDDAVLKAMKFAFQRLKVVLEPSGAAPLAALLKGEVDVAGRTVAVIGSGGNVDAETFIRALSA